MLFLLNLSVLLIFVNVFLPITINREFVNLREEVNEEARKYIEYFESCSDSKTAFEDLNVKDGIVVVISDIEDEIVHVYPNEIAYEKMMNHEELFYKSASKFFITDPSIGRQIYFINVYSYVQSYRQITYSLIVKIIITEIIMSAIILWAFSYYINVSVLRPIMSLEKRITSYRIIKKMDGQKHTDEIEKLNLDFENLVKALDDEQSKQNRMIASVSHDVKTPLTSILGYSEQLNKDGITDERRKKYTSTIYSKALAIKQIINNLDDYMSYNGSNKSEKKEMTTMEFLERFVSYFEEDFQNEDIFFSLSNECENAVININELSIMRVFGNLIDNSVKHKRDNERLSIAIDCKEKKDEIIFSFSDNGKGVPNNQYTNIFEPFYTTDKSRSKAVSGLGLSICEEIITEHGGTIWASESKQGGLCITFTLLKIR